MAVAVVGAAVAAVAEVARPEAEVEAAAGAVAWRPAPGPSC